MDKDRLDLLLRRATRPALSKQDQERKLLDFMMWSLERRPRPSRDTSARARAKALVKTPEVWEYYVVLSKDSPVAWKTLQALVAELWYQDPPSPDLFFMPGEIAVSPLLHWIMDVGAGKRTAPTKRGPDPTGNSWRNIVIGVTVHEIVGVGRLGVQKACELVEKRLREEGYERFGYESVYRTCWLPYSRSLRE